jgi:hypothetical protein
VANGGWLTTVAESTLVECALADWAVISCVDGADWEINVRGKERVNNAINVPKKFGRVGLGWTGRENRRWEVWDKLPGCIERGERGQVIGARPGWSLGQCKKVCRSCEHFHGSIVPRTSQKTVFKKHFYKFCTIFVAPKRRILTVFWA